MDVGRVAWGPAPYYIGYGVTFYMGGLALSGNFFYDHTSTIIHH
jgi:hypothetical protein